MSLLHQTTLQSDARHHPPWLRALQNCDDGDDDDNDDDYVDDDYVEDDNYCLPPHPTYSSFPPQNPPESMEVKR